MKPFFRELKDGQNPSAMIVSCSDSRIVPDLVTNSDPGTLFTVRNVGNLVPLSGNRDSAAGAAIEYAVDILQVPRLIVMGHSSCGAMNAVLKGRDKLKDEHLKNWLRHIDEAIERLPENGDTDMLSQINVLVQLKRLWSYECVQQAVGRGELQMEGWWYDFEKGKVFLWIRQRKILWILFKSPVAGPGFFVFTGNEGLQLLILFSAEPALNHSICS